MIKNIILLVLGVFTISCSSEEKDVSVTPQLDSYKLSNIKGVWRVSAEETVKWVNEESKYSKKKKKLLREVYASKKLPHNFMQLTFKNNELILSFGKLDKREFPMKYTLVKYKEIEIENDQMRFVIKVISNNILKIYSFDKIRNFEAIEFWTRK